MRACQTIRHGRANGAETCVSHAVPRRALMKRPGHVAGWQRNNLVPVPPEDRAGPPASDLGDGPTQFTQQPGQLPSMTDMVPSLRPEPADAGPEPFATGAQMQAIRLVERFGEPVQFSAQCGHVPGLVDKAPGLAIHIIGRAKDTFFDTGNIVPARGHKSNIHKARPHHFVRSRHLYCGKTAGNAPRNASAAFRRWGREPGEHDPHQSLQLAFQTAVALGRVRALGQDLLAGHARLRHHGNAI